MIKTIVFDLGGVIFSQNYEKAVSHFEEIGVSDARRLLDPFAQAGFVGVTNVAKMNFSEVRKAAKSR